MTRTKHTDRAHRCQSNARFQGSTRRADLGEIGAKAASAAPVSVPLSE